MYKFVNKKEIMIEIRDIEEKYCVDCPLIAQWRKDHGNYKAPLMCMTECKTGKRLQKLGDILTYGRPTRTARDLTEERYLELHEKGMTDAQIVKEYGIGSKTLKDRKRHWGIKHCEEKWTTLPLRKYKEYRSEGLSDVFICMILKWDPKTMIKFKKKHGLVNMRPLHHVTHTEDGREITPQLYKEDIKIHKTDIALSEAWGMNISTFQRAKRKWREDGLL